MDWEKNEITIPGKVFFYGGYSVLLEGHISLSIAVVDKEGNGVNAKWRIGEERIISPQFNIDTKPKIDIDNKELVSYAYVIGKTYLSMHGIWKGVEIELWNSPIFGSKDEKTGLGSSAAATVAIIKALFSANGIDPEMHVETIFKLAQLAYGWYSGKIGSAFDIATSAIGQSIIYYRYDPKAVVLPDKVNAESIVYAVEQTVNKPWKWVKIERANIKDKVGLLVFNIKGASTSTISAVKAWKKWKLENEEKFFELMEEQRKVEEIAIAALLEGKFDVVREYTRKARAVHREMQDEIAKIVPSFEKVEPEELTKLIDRVEEEVDGVIAGRCPGAGGRDSVAFLVEKGKEIDKEKIIRIAKEIGLELEAIDVEVV